MKKIVGSVLLGLGVLALLAALVIKVWVAPNAIKLPTDTNVRTEATGTGSGIDLATNQQFTDIPLTARRHLVANEKASNDDVVVWEMTVKLTDPTGKPLTSYVHTVGVDRDNAKAVRGHGEKIVDAQLGERQIQNKGWSYHFPFDTKKKSYDFFDANTGQAFPAKYVDEKEIDDLKTYHFKQEVPATKLRSVQVPGAAVGSPAATVTLDIYYTNVRDIYVEPVSGWIVKADESAKTTLRMPGTDADAMTVLTSDLSFTEDTVDDLVDTAEDDKEKIELVQKKAPLTLLIVGALLVLAGVIVLARSRTPKPGKHSAPEEPATP